MLNLSQLARGFHDSPLFKRIQSIRNPEIYLAENLADYQENAPSLEFPFSYKFVDRRYIIFQNIGLKKLVYEEMEIPNWFVLHDNSGQELIYWNADHELFPTMASFDEVQAEQGFKDDDWICDVFIRYLI